MIAVVRWVGVAAISWSAFARSGQTMEHTVVYHEPGYFAAWPANNGLWRLSDDTWVVGFTRARFEEKPGQSIYTEGAAIAVGEIPGDVINEEDIEDLITEEDLVEEDSDNSENTEKQ